MGTSSSFKGKVGNALLPNDFNSDDDILDGNIGNDDYKDDDKNTTENSINWTTAKTSMSKYISSSGKVGSPKSIVRNYIKASGGSSRLISNSSNSRTAASKIGNILIKLLMILVCRYKIVLCLKLCLDWLIMFRILLYQRMMLQ